MLRRIILYFGIGILSGCNINTTPENVIGTYAFTENNTIFEVNIVNDGSYTNVNTVLGKRTIINQNKWEWYINKSGEKMILFHNFIFPENNSLTGMWAVIPEKKWWSDALCFDADLDKCYIKQ